MEIVTTPRQLPDTISTVEPTTEGFHFQERDNEILLLICEYRLIRTDQVASLLGESSVRGVRRRMGMMVDAGIIHRYPIPGKDALTRSNERAYGLALAGTKRVAQLLGVKQSSLKKRIGSAFIAHTVMIPDFVTALHYTVKMHPNIRLIGIGEILADAPDYSCLPIHPRNAWVVKYQYRGVFKEQSVHPDIALFGFELLDQPKGKNKMYFAYEADNGSESHNKVVTAGQTVFSEKLIKYDCNT